MRKCACCGKQCQQDRQYISDEDDGRMFCGRECYEVRNEWFSIRSEEMRSIQTRACAGPVRAGMAIPYKVWLGDGSVLVEGWVYPTNHRRYESLRHTVLHPPPPR